MILLTGWGMQPKHRARQGGTLRFYSELAYRYKYRRLKIITFPCVTDTSYAEAMRSVWGQDDIICLEHDLVPTMEQFERMTDATDSVTAQAYYLYHDRDSVKATLRTLEHAKQDEGTKQAISATLDLNTLEQIAREYRKARSLYQLYGTQSHVAVIAHRRIQNGQERWILPFEGKSDLWGLGFTKISKRVQREVDPACIDGHWIRMDDRISRAVHKAGIRADVTWPAVEHNHKPTEPLFGGGDSR